MFGQRVALSPGDIWIARRQILTAAVRYALGSLLVATLVIISASAAPVRTTDSSTNELAFASDVSSSDLLHGRIPVTSGAWVTGTPASPLTINDGVHGNSYDVDNASSVAWGNPGATVTYELGNGDGYGWNITSIQSIAAWVNVGFGNQAYSVSVRYVGETAFTPLPGLSVDFQPLTRGTPYDPGATRVRITDDTGSLIEGVSAIRFTLLLVNGGDNGGGFTLREIDVFGEVAPSDDADGDGMSDAFELAHTDPPSATALEPDDDPDHDGLNNLEEYQAKSDPLNPDTDGDTLEDGAEVHGAELRPPTDPTNPDTDGDGLGDEVETHTGIFLGLSDTGTNPTLRDTDGDSFDDFDEVHSGTDPNDPKSHPQPPLRIMAVGDSITAGYTDNPAWNVPFNFGYRSGLYSRLVEAGVRFQFVGSSPEPWNNAFGDPSHGGSHVPSLDLRALGQDHHEGYGGASIGQIQSRIGNAIETHQPNVILLMIGINGIGAGSPAALDSLVGTIISAAPKVHLIVAQITPLASYNQSLLDYNTYIRQILVPTKAAGGARISTVDLYSIFLTDPKNPASIGAGYHSNRINHPNELLYDRMAENWFQAIRQLGLLNPPVPQARLRPVGGGLFDLYWTSKAGRRYTIRASDSLSVPPSEWPVFESLANLPARPPQNSIPLPKTTEAKKFFVIEEYDTAGAK